VQVRQVAALLKLKIVDSPDGVAGVATVNDDGRPLSGFMHQGTLTIDEREPERRRRFTIAHEVAHVVLGHQSVLGESHKLLAELLDDDVERLFGPRSSASVAQAEASRLVEREANLLAGQLLVPDRALDAALAEHGVCLPVLAGVFDVSVPLVRVRLGSRISPTIRRVSVW
jgi:Zn-dependent peptidase ImmA (M78 family)